MSDSRGTARNMSRLTDNADRNAIG